MVEPEIDHRKRKINQHFIPDSRLNCKNGKKIGVTSENGGTVTIWDEPVNFTLIILIPVLFTAVPFTV